MNRLMPTAAQLTDLGLLLALSLVASLGFRHTYNGFSYLVAAGVGLLLGTVLAHLANVLKKPVILLALSAVLAFFLLGGAIAFYGEGLRSVLPLPSTVVELADQSVHGWKDLLTTLAPVDGGPLLVLPYLMGLVAGAAGTVLAGRTTSAYWPLAAPLAYFAAVILLGVQEPSRLLPVGAAFAALAVTWIGIRARRQRPQQLTGGHPWRHRAVAAVLVVGAAAAAVVVGPRLPGAESQERLVIRTYVTPPFDVGQYPSPLVSFRKYSKGYACKCTSEKDKLYNRPLMTVAGLPAGTKLRFAALDRYNGTVWGASNQAPETQGADGSFQRVGTVINDSGPGKTYQASVTLADGYSGVWLPTTGSVTRLDFTGGSAEAEAASFRYNLATDTGVVPRGLRAGDSYDFTAHVAPAANLVDAEMVAASAGQSENTSGIDFLPVATRWGEDATSPTAQVLSIAHYLQRVGTYTDGGAGEQQYTAGHSVGRLSKFSAQGQQIAGDDEQYAAMMSVLANQVGVPTRVVMGAIVPDGGVVKGRDVRAWVEIRDVSGTWRELPTEAFMNRDRPPEDQPPTPQDLVSGDVIPPPTPVRPPATAGDPLSTDENRKARPKKDDDAFPIAAPGWLVAAFKYVVLPLALLALIGVAVVGVKALRRSRRRTRGAPAKRLSAAWRELVDNARDHGFVVNSFRTRREQASQVGLIGMTEMARAADRHVFGESDPTDEEAAAYWSDVDRMRREIARTRGRRARILGAVSLTSFRRPPRAEAH